MKFFTEVSFEYRRFISWKWLGRRALLHRAQDIIMESIQGSNDNRCIESKQKHHGSASSRWSSALKSLTFSSFKFLSPTTAGWATDSHVSAGGRGAIVVDEHRQSVGSNRQSQSTLKDIGNSEGSNGWYTTCDCSLGEQGTHSTALMSDLSTKPKSTLDI